MKYPTRLSDAVHILAFIALYPDCDLTSNKLAESVQTNPAYVRQLMSALRKGRAAGQREGTSPGLLWLVSRRKSLCWMPIGQWRVTSPCSIRTSTPILPVAWV